MDGANAEETAASELVARVGSGTVSPWLVAELFLLGDRAVAPLEELARGTFGAEHGRRALGARILAAIGSPAARAALRRVGQTGAARGASGLSVPCAVVSAVGSPASCEGLVPPSDHQIEARGSDGPA